MRETGAGERKSRNRQSEVYMTKPDNRKERFEQVTVNLLVFFTFLFNITNLLCNGLECVFVIRILCLKLCRLSARFRSRRPRPTNLAASLQRPVAETSCLSLQVVLEGNVDIP